MTGLEDLNVAGHETLIAPEALKQRLPVTAAAARERQARP